jgi:Do/DeqQ family serine protease
MVHFAVFCLDELMMRVFLLWLITLNVVFSAPPIAAAGKAVPSSREEISLSFAPLVRKAAPAVVNIYTQKIVRARQAVPLFNDPFFRRFFGQQFDLGQNQSRTRKQNSLGSGVIVQADGLIVTNKHVIEGADEIRVVLADRREFEATIAVMDEKTDLAVLRIQTDGEQLPVLGFRDSDDLEVGDLVLAIGNPFGVGQTVTSGIVSAVTRTTIGESDLNAFIQTDAAINPGNSGGALIAMDGRLVGINTAIFSKSGGSHGIGFAVPSNMVRAVLRGINTNGKLVRPWLGATGQVVNHDIANSLGLKRPGGVLVNAVHNASAAARGGLRVGDVVLAINGHDIQDGNSLKHRVATLPVGETAVLRVWRAGKTRALKVRLVAAPEKPRRNQTLMEGDQPLAGATVVNLSPALAEELSIDPFLEGVMIVRTVRGSPANRLRFRSGDIVKTVNGNDVATVSNLLDEMRRPTARWRVGLLRGGESREMVINR